MPEAQVAASLEQTSFASVALLTPYDGGNLGDAAIQEALLQNLRRMDPRVLLSGITLYPDKTSAAHHIPCFPLAVTSLPFYHYSEKTKPGAQLLSGTTPSMLSRLFRKLVRVPGASIIRKPWRAVLRLQREIRHAVQSYSLLRRVDLLVIAGGGQLDEEWGGSWGHPFALMKWCVLARMAGCSVAFLSVGGCVTESRLTKLFLRVALSMARYSSYRDKGSRELAMNINPHANGPVVPDLAFSLPSANFPVEDRIEHSRLRVGVSPIAYAHPRLWPTHNPEKYKNYMIELGAFITSLLRQGISVTLFSCATPDEQIFRELRSYLDPALEELELHRLSLSNVESLPDLLALLKSFDFVVASRLHGLLLSFLSGKPSLAISYDRKVECLMNELEQNTYCLDIGSIKNGDLLAMFSRLQRNAQVIPPRLSEIRETYNQLLELQYQKVRQILSSGTRGLQKTRNPLPARDPGYEDSSEVGRVS